jgi:hypothetical protein
MKREEAHADRGEMRSTPTFFSWAGLQCSHRPSETKCQPNRPYGREVTTRNRVYIPLTMPNLVRFWKGAGF